MEKLLEMIHQIVSRLKNRMECTPSEVQLLTRKNIELQRENLHLRQRVRELKNIIRVLEGEGA